MFAVPKTDHVIFIQKKRIDLLHTLVSLSCFLTRDIYILHSSQRDL